MTTVLFYGDSRAADWPPPNLPPLKFVNRGTGGQTSIEALHAVEAVLGTVQPQMVVVQIGVNDLAALSFYPERQREIVSGCKQTIQQLVARLAALTSTIILTTIFPVGDVEMFFYQTDAVVEAVDDVNDFIRTLAAPDIAVFDSYAILAAEDGLVQPDYALDMLHINRRGYEALNRELVNVLTDRSESR